MGEPCPIQPGRHCPRISTAQPLFEVKDIPLILKSESFAWIGTRLRYFGYSASDLKVLLRFNRKNLSCKIPASWPPVLSSVIRLPWYSRCVSILYSHVSSVLLIGCCRGLQAIYRLSANVRGAAGQRANKVPIRQPDSQLPRFGVWRLDCVILIRNVYKSLAGSLMQIQPCIAITSRN